MSACLSRADWVLANADAAAVEAVDAAVASFLENEERERIRLYRLCLQATIKAVSPVAQDLAAHGGMAIGGIVRELPVPATWPWTPIRERRPSEAWDWSAGPAKNGIGSTSFRIARRLARRGILVRDAQHPLGELGFSPEGSVLEAVARLGPCFMDTLGPRARLHLPHRMPETLLTAMVDRQVDAIVDHPVLNGRGYVVGSAEHDEYRDGTVLEFGTGLLPLQLPWADLLDAEVQCSPAPAGVDRRR